MADLTSLYRKNPKRDLAIQTCVDCINYIGEKYPDKFLRAAFNEFFDITGGTQPPKSKFIHSEKEGYVRFLQIRDFSSEDTLTYIPESRNNKLCNQDDILLGRYGASIGKILTGKSGAYNVACAKVSIIEQDLVENDFLFYWLHNSKFQSDIKSFSRSAQGGFNKNDLSRIEVNLPQKELQKEFVSLLKVVDQSIVSNAKPSLEIVSKDILIRELVKMIDKFLFLINEFELLNIEYTYQLTQLDNLNQAILQEAVQGKLVNQDPSDEPASELLKRIKAEKAKSSKKEKPLPPIKPEEIPFEIPSTWVWCRLGEIADLITSGSRDWAQFHSDKGAIFVRMGNLSKNSFDLRLDKIQFVEPPKNQEGNRTRLIENDILVSITGEVGNLGLIPKDFGEAYINQHTALVRLNNQSVHRYIAFTFLSKFLKDQFNAPQRGMKNSFRLTDIEFLIIPLPPLSEQKRIVAEIEKQLAKTKLLKEHIIANQQATEQLLKALLHQAFEVREMETTYN